MPGGCWLAAAAIRAEDSNDDCQRTATDTQSAGAAPPRQNCFGPIRSTEKSPPRTNHSSARPSNAASARKSRSTRRIGTADGLHQPTSFFRSIATLVIAAITQSAVSKSTIPTVAVNNPLMRL